MRRLLIPPAAFLAVAFVYPLWATLRQVDAAAWGWAWTSPLVHDRLIGAILMASLSVVLTFAAAVPLAWWYHRRNIHLGSIQMAIHAAPFVLPVFVIVFGIQAVFGRGGWIMDVTGIDVLATIGPMGTIALAHAYYNYGFAARLLHATLERRPDRLEAAAQVLGASRWQAFMRTTLPLLAPGIASIALLVFLFSLTSFGVVLYMGDGAIATLEVLLYENLRGAFPKPARAAALGVMQLGINVALLLAYLALMRRTDRLPAARRDTPPCETRHAVIGWLSVAIALLPALAVLVGGFRVRGVWSLEPWRALLQSGHPAHVPRFDLWHALGRTAEYASASAAIALALSLCLAYGLRGMRTWARRIAETMAALPLGTSSLLIGLGMVFATSVAFVADPARGRMLIIAAHALVAFPFTTRALLPAINQLDARSDEAAALLGARPWQVAWRIHRPALAAPLIAALGLALAMSIGDFGASLLLMNAENRGVAVWIDAIGNPFNPIMRAQGVALAGLLMLLAAGAYAAVEAVDRRPTWR